MLINKLKDFLINTEKILNHQLKESQSTYSYVYGRLVQIKDVMEWINELPNVSKIDEILKRIEENNCIETYSYCGFNYYELKKLRELI